MADFKISEELLPNVFLIEHPYFPDNRGDFAKLFNKDSFSNNGINFLPAESFLTRSKKDVLRGMHYQDGEASHDKLVACIKGKVIDVIVDIRPESKYFNKPRMIELSEKDNKVLFIGEGYAHGFYTIEDDTWLLYLTSTVHDPSKDKGILWSSIDFKWPSVTPILSQRDQNHPGINHLI